jgi:AmmeMemoRadiSam system protein B
VVLCVLVVCAWALWHVLPAQHTASVSGAVLPHHDVVRDIRADFLKTLATKVTPKTIILVSPNHFGVGGTGVAVYSEALTTVYGNVPQNEEVITALSSAGFSVDNAAFEFEHGIRSPLADIARYFNGIRVVPLMIKTDVTYDEVVRLGETLKAACEECLMLASVDFSHYQTAQVGALHDEVSIRALMRTDAQYLFSAPEIDSPQTLALLGWWARAQGTPSFMLVHHTNSGEILPQFAHETTTHLMGYYADNAVQRESPRTTFMIADARYSGIPKQVPSRREFWDRLMRGVDDAWILGREDGCERESTVVPIASGTTALTVVPFHGGRDTVEAGVRRVYEAREAKSRVVVCAQWGVYERAARTAIAEQMIDAGADMVLGEAVADEHRIEVYREKPIFSIATKGDMREAYILSGILSEDTLRISVSTVRATSTFDVHATSPEGHVLFASLAAYRDRGMKGEWYTFPL